MGYRVNVTYPKVLAGLSVVLKRQVEVNRAVGHLVNDGFEDLLVCGKKVCKCVGRRLGRALSMGRVGNVKKDEMVGGRTWGASLTNTESQASDTTVVYHTLSVPAGAIHGDSAQPPRIALLRTINLISRTTRWNHRFCLNHTTCPETLIWDHQFSHWSRARLQF